MRESPVGQGQTPSCDPSGAAGGIRVPPADDQRRIKWGDFSTPEPGRDNRDSRDTREQGPLLSLKSLLSLASEGNVVFFGLAEAALVVRGALRRRGLRGRGGRTVGLEVAAAPAEHLEVLADDLGLVPLLARLLVVPGTRLEPSLQVDLLALGEVLAGDLGLLAPDDDLVPLGLLLLLAVLVPPAAVGGQGEAGDRLPRRGRPHLGVAAQVADQDHFVDHCTFLLWS